MTQRRFNYSSDVAFGVAIVLLAIAVIIWFS